MFNASSTCTQSSEITYGLIQRLPLFIVICYVLSAGQILFIYITRSLSLKGECQGFSEMMDENVQTGMFSNHVSSILLSLLSQELYPFLRSMSSQHPSHQAGAMSLWSAEPQGLQRT